MLKLRGLGSRLLREPMAHFLIAGALVFALLSGRPPDPGDRRIVVDEAVVSRLVDRWTRTFRRAPTQAEIEGLIRDYVSDQVYYREGVRLGLDRDDDVVIRRMRMKMLSMIVADSDTRSPSDEELRKVLAADPERYSGEASVDFEQVYLGADGPATRDFARVVAKRLDAGEPAGAPLQAAPLPRHFRDASPEEIDADFGEGFARTIAQLPQGGWRGPIASGLGVHVVRVTTRRAPRSPTLGDVRQRLENDWRDAAMKQAERRRYREMLRRYDVVIERPE